jgi:hypothetical protein
MATSTVSPPTRQKRTFVPTVAYLALVVLLASVVAVTQFRDTRHDWQPDAQIYLWMAIQDAGLSPPDALAASRAFMTQQVDAGGKPPYRTLYSTNPPPIWNEQFPLFRSRPLYPYLSGRLYHRYGPFAMKAISAIAYVASVACLYLILLMLTTPLRSAIGAAAFATEQIVLQVATAPLTDTLASFLWIAVLGAVIAYARRPGAGPLLIIGIVGIALTLTRPAFFLPLGAGVGAYLTLRKSSEFRSAIAPLLAALPALVAFFAFSIVVHGPSAASQLHWQYEWSTLHAGVRQSEAVWYVATMAKSLAAFALYGVRDVGGVTLVALSVVGIIRFVGRVDTATICTSAAIASVIALFLNPIDFDRPVLLPVAPLVVILAMLNFARAPITRQSVGSEELADGMLSHA